MASKYSPAGFFQAGCFIDGTVPGNLGRNAGTRPWTFFNDLRISRRFNVWGESTLEGIVDVFNVVNRFNVADVNPLYSRAGTPTAAFDPRQLQLALKLRW